MTGGQAAVIGERVAIVETKIDAVVENIASLSAKMDKVLEGQAEGKQDRADLRATIGKMAPDVALIASMRSGGKTLVWVGGITGSIVTTLVYAKSWIILNWNWFLGR